MVWLTYVSLERNFIKKIYFLETGNIDMKIGFLCKGIVYVSAYESFAKYEYINHENILY
jgi:hypothetical protein